MQQYAIYLRKSRSDAEAEQKEKIDVLQRHKALLIELARNQKLPVVKTFEEVVSGDNIASRPQMQSLLSEVEQGVYSGVLVMDVDRLARGDTIDQGLVAQAFKYSNTKIITPIKTYDPNNEFDEEYFEFGLFMSRREYKIINRRLQRGRLASVKEGKYVGSTPPYGYIKKRLEHEKGYTLEPHPEQAETVQLIFRLYTTGEEQADGSFNRLGITRIARRLTDLNIQPQKGLIWSAPSIRDILINPVYIGKLRWNWRPEVKRVVDGQITTERPRADADTYTLVDGLHKAIITSDTYEAAQAHIKTNRPRPIGERSTVKNPLAGLMVCGKCGKKMVRRPHTKRDYPPTLLCTYTHCKNKSTAFHSVENRVLQAISEWLAEYKLQWEPDNLQKSDCIIETRQKSLKKISRELEVLEKQRLSLHDLLERGIYDNNTFLERSRNIADRVQQAEKDKAAIESSINLMGLNDEARKTVIPKAERILEVYAELATAQAKNDMLKELLEKVTYAKEADGRAKGAPDDFEIILYPKIPQSIIHQ